MRYDTIIVLGGGYTKKGRLSKIVKSRIDKALELFFDKKAEKIILSSGFKRKEQRFTEAELLSQYCLKKGANFKNLIREEFSLDTIGNAFFCKKYITDARKFFNLIVVTSDFHIRRSKFIFSKIFGKNYKIKFIKSLNNVCKKRMKKLLKSEKRKLFLCKEFFNGIEDGDTESVEKRLFNIHPFYTCFKRSAKHDTIFDSFRIKRTGNV